MYMPRLPLVQPEDTQAARHSGYNALRCSTKGLDQSAANSLPQNLHTRAVAMIGSRQYGQGARPSVGSGAAPVLGLMHAQTSAATQPNNVQPRNRLRTKMAPRLRWSRSSARIAGMKYTASNNDMIKNPAISPGALSIPSSVRLLLRASVASTGWVSLVAVDRELEIPSW